MTRHMRPSRLALAFLLNLATIAAAQTPAAVGVLRHGVVFADANGNGVLDAREQRLAGVMVSNQDTVVLTDSAGAFRIPTSSTGMVFVSVPDGYQSKGPFWRASGTASATLDFPLVTVPSSSDFSFAYASDTHISPKSQDRTHRMREMVDALHPAFVLVAGDLVRDALRVPEAEARSYYDLFQSEARQFRTPIWTVPGNHENFGIERKLSHVDPRHPLLGRGMYRSYFGPDYYSFTHGGIHFIALNTVDIDDQSYYGHVDSLQLAWLAKDLAHVPADMPVITFDHIPFATAFDQFGGYDDGPPAPSLITVRGKTAYRHTVSNATDVLAVLRTHKHILALGAHIHAREKLVFETDGVMTRFETSPAVVGPSQVGPLTFPSGFVVYTVHAGVVDSGRFVPLDCAGTCQ
jgi:hypothetical protein